MRFDAVFRAAATGKQLTFADHAYANRIGWREIVVTARDGAHVAQTSALATSRSDELRAYPQSLLRSPLDMRSATVELHAGELARRPRRRSVSRRRPSTGTAASSR